MRNVVDGCLMANPTQLGGIEKLGLVTDKAKMSGMEREPVVVRRIQIEIDMQITFYQLTVIAGGDQWLVGY